MADYPYAELHRNPSWLGCTEPRSSSRAARQDPEHAIFVSRVTFFPQKNAKMCKWGCDRESSEYICKQFSERDLAGSMYFCSHQSSSLQRSLFLTPKKRMYREEKNSKNHYIGAVRRTRHPRTTTPKIKLGCRFECPDRNPIRQKGRK